jgi:hypothetical protein
MATGLTSVCVDLRPLNNRTTPDRYKMPHPDDIFQAIGKSNIFTHIDLRSGFHQIPIAAEDQKLRLGSGSDLQLLLVSIETLTSNQCA